MLLGFFEAPRPIRNNRRIGFGGVHIDLGQGDWMYRAPKSVFRTAFGVMYRFPTDRWTKLGASNQLPLKIAAYDTSSAGFGNCSRMIPAQISRNPIIAIAVPMSVSLKP